MPSKNSKFTPISVEAYIEMYSKNNPRKCKEELRNSLYKMLQVYLNGKQCNCGNANWVIGSASLGKKFFACITVEEYPRDKYY